MGCGRVGSSLATELELLGHTVSIIDQSREAFRRLGPDFKGRTISGIGFDRDTLLEAGIETADAFAAVSNGDNSNILAARVARETYGVANVVARIYDPGRAEIYQRLGIPTVATVLWATDQIMRRLVPEGALMRIAIAGAGNVGRAIARELLDNGHEVLLIDRDPKALKLDSVPDAQWLMADACEISSLDKAALSTAQVLVAATGDDKVNLVASLLAKTEYGVPRVVARINHPKNEWMFDSSWGVDVAVSTPRIISALVEEAVSVGDVVRLFSFRQGEANLVELTLPDDSSCIGKTVEEIELPDNASLAAIVRDGRVISPTAADVFSAGDELLFVASATAEDLIKGCFIKS